MKGTKLTHGLHTKATPRQEEVTRHRDPVTSLEVFAAEFKELHLASLNETAKTRLKNHAGFVQHVATRPDLTVIMFSSDAIDLLATAMSQDLCTTWYVDATGNLVSGSLYGYEWMFCAKLIHETYDCRQLLMKAPFLGKRRGPYSIQHLPPGTQPPSLTLPSQVGCQLVRCSAWSSLRTERRAPSTCPHLSSSMP